jgi:hypothetical protein
MNVLDHLVSLIDNGGQRLYAKRRRNLRFRVIPERRTNPDRRKIIDRRTVPNEKSIHGPERRMVFKGYVMG